MAEKDNIRDEHAAKLSTESLLEDVLNFNTRGLKSILVLWLRPRDYFIAARLRDWGGQYTPSIRIWLAFFALFSAFKFWWIEGNPGLVGAYATGFSDADVPLPAGVTYDDIAQEAIQWIFGLVPFLQIVCLILLSMVFRAWGEASTFALRQRYFFAVMIPSSSLMPLFMTIMVFVPSDMIEAYAFSLAAVTFIIDFLVGYRGAFQSLGRLQRFWRAALLSGLIVVTNVGTSVATQIAGIVVVATKYENSIAG
jgi:hypothetical protein